MLANLVAETATTTGTGNFTLAARRRPETDVQFCGQHWVSIDRLVAEVVTTAGATGSVVRMDSTALDSRLLRRDFRASSEVRRTRCRCTTARLAATGCVARPLCHRGTQPGVIAPARIIRQHMPLQGGHTARPLRSHRPHRCRRHGRGVARHQAAAWGKFALKLQFLAFERLANRRTYPVGTLLWFEVTRAI